MDADRILAGDRRHLWHPYAAAGASDAPVVPGTEPEVVVSAHGPYLELAEGRRLVDGMAS